MTACSPASSEQAARDYQIRTVRRPVVRALGLPLAPGFTLATLREAHRRLSDDAAVRGLSLAESPLLVLRSDPLAVPRADWSWQLALPVTGLGRAPGEAELVRLHGGTYVEAVTDRGFAELPRLYRHVLGRIFPRFKHALTRPCILHRVIAGLEQDDPGAVLVAVLLPAQLSLERGRRA
ncbi:MAG: hypothetical protein HY744_24755 [Deltaproteobacteria bacterium]|nr:hypothetical protein [Deltaproteobacteria bacterium]